MSTKCPNCGFENGPAYKLCRNCNRELPYPESDAVSSRDDAPPENPPNVPIISYEPVLQKKTEGSLKLDFSDETAPGEAMKSVPPVMSKEVDLKDDGLKHDSEFASRISSALVENAPAAAFIKSVSIAPFPKRSLAASMDFFIVSIITGLVIAAGTAVYGAIHVFSIFRTAPGAVIISMLPAITALFTAIWVAYCFFFQVLYGHTPGKALLGISVISDDGKPIATGRSMIRAATTIITFSTLLIGYLWIIVDDNGQAIHDKAAGTLVINDQDRRGNSI